MIRLGDKPEVRDVCRTPDGEWKLAVYVYRKSRLVRIAWLQRLRILKPEAYTIRYYVDVSLGEVKKLIEVLGDLIRDGKERPA